MFAFFKKLLGAVKSVLNLGTLADMKAILEQHTQDLGQANLKLRTIMDTVADGIVVCNSDGRIVSVNSAAAAMFGYGEGEMLGLSASALTPPTHRRRHEDALRKYVSGGIKPATSVVTANGLRKDGSIFPVEINVRGAELDNEIIMVAAIRDVTERHNYEAKFQRISECGLIGIASRTSDGRIIQANEPWFKITGYCKDDLAAGLNYLDITPKEFHEFEKVQFTAAFRGETVPPYEKQYIRKGGGLVWVQMHLTLIAPNEVAAYVVDINERKIQERRKDEFLAMLSHELRNPLAPIITSAQLIGKHGHKSSETVESSVRMIERQTKHLSRLVDDLLDVSRITRGKIHLRKEMADLRELAYRSAENARPLMETRHHELQLDICPQMVYSECDPARIEQVISNLLNNAAKYTEQGGKIMLFMRATEQLVEIIVKDTGIGISPDMQEEIFDLFVQAERTLDRAEGGLGIGLTLVKSLVQMHGGTVHVHSEGLGKGSEFAVRLPIVHQTRTREAAVQEPETKEKFTILIVDDNQDAANSLQMLLRIEGHTTETAYNAADGLRIAEKWRPQVILLDIGLPKMDGHEMARQLRANNNQAVLIALTGYGYASDVQMSIEAGIDRHLVKPAAPKELMAAIAAAVAEKRSTP